MDKEIEQLELFENEVVELGQPIDLSQITAEYFMEQIVAQLEKSDDFELQMSYVDNLDNVHNVYIKLMNEDIGEVTTN